MDFATLRRNMIEGQIRPNRVTDERIFDAMGSLPREKFVPKARLALAYADEAVEIAPGRYLMEPMLAARLVEAAAICPTDAVLLIGAGSGYMAAVLARLASAVVALESDPALAKDAAWRLGEVGVDTVSVIEGPLPAGYPRQAPYDAIVFNGAVEEIPHPVISQLADGGRLAAIVASGGSTAHRLGKAMVVTRIGDAFARREIFDGGTPLLPGFAKKPAFVF
jgi:protein-L-isoaspartate(D-aspartate) O-methyltransferase